MKPGEFGPRRVEKEQADRFFVFYSDGVMKLPTKALRLSGLLHVSPRPCPWNVCAIANAGIACSTFVSGRYQTSSLRQLWWFSFLAPFWVFARLHAVRSAFILRST